MRKAVLIILFFLFCKSGFAQFYDRTWLVGGPMVKLIFNGNTIDTVLYNPTGGVVGVSSGAEANVSDTSGNLLFYCIGNTIGNNLAQIMENGDTLTDSLFYNYFSGGFDEPHTSLILPRSNNKFYIFYFSESDSLFSQNYQQPDRMYYAEVDMNYNGGLGKVVRKKQLLHSGVLGDCRLTATRHANGRDWWLVHQGFRNNQYFVYLVTPDSIYAPHIQQLGPAFYDDNNAAQSAFSPDGSKYVTISSVGPLFLMDFDRCTGTFSHADSIDIPIDTFKYNTNTYITPYGGGSGCCFSASGRYMYRANFFKIVQYDTWATNVANTAIEVGRWDSVGSAGGFLEFYDMYLLPNGKIIVEDYNGGGSRYHTIDSPDIAGIGCHYNFSGISVNTLNTNVLPNMINYRLGVLSGSGCDTITGIDEAEARNIKVKVYPNPASDRITISIGRYEKEMDLHIYDALGKEVYRNGSMYLDQEINISGFSKGLYLIRVSSAGGDAAVKFIKE